MSSTFLSINSPFIYISSPYQHFIYIFCFIERYLARCKLFQVCSAGCSSHKNLISTFMSKFIFWWSKPIRYFSYSQKHISEIDLHNFTTLRDIKPDIGLIRNPQIRSTDYFSSSLQKSHLLIIETYTRYFSCIRIYQKLICKKHSGMLNLLSLIFPTKILFTDNPNLY